MTVALDDFLDEVGQSMYGWPPSLRFTYDKTRELLADGVKGDLVECGVAAGVHPAVMARACIDAGEARTVRLCDSFQGVRHGGPNDTYWNTAWGDGSGRLESSGVIVQSRASVEMNLHHWLGPFGTPGLPHFVFTEGWFQETLGFVAADMRERGQSIAFLRLDGDVYESGMACLTHLYPLVSSGGIVLEDDYYGLDGAGKAVDDYFDGHPPDITRIEGGDGDGWWRVP